MWVIVLLYSFSLIYYVSVCSERRKGSLSILFHCLCNRQEKQTDSPLYSPAKYKRRNIKGKSNRRRSETAWRAELPIEICSCLLLLIWITYVDSGCSQSKFVVLFLSWIKSKSVWQDLIWIVKLFNLWHLNKVQDHVV